MICDIDGWVPGGVQFGALVARGDLSCDASKWEGTPSRGCLHLVCLFEETPKWWLSFGLVV